jgi:sugar (pentulose or hexulose) kinase
VRAVPPCSALWKLLASIPAEQRRRIASLAIDGTSATTLLIDGGSGRCLAPPKMYNEAQNAAVVAHAKQMAPPDHAATAATSTLCKVLAWDEAGVWQAAAAAAAGAEGGELEPAILHQADWVAALLHGEWRVTDYNNALKLGYDPAEEAYPEWLAEQVRGGGRFGVGVCGVGWGPAAWAASAHFCKLQGNTLVV